MGVVGDGRETFDMTSRSVEPRRGRLIGIGVGSRQQGRRNRRKDDRLTGRRVETLSSTSHASRSGTGGASEDAEGGTIDAELGEVVAAELEARDLGDEGVHRADQVVRVEFVLRRVFKRALFFRTLSELSVDQSGVAERGEDGGEELARVDALEVLALLRRHGLAPEQDVLLLGLRGVRLDEASIRLVVWAT